MSVRRQSADHALIRRARQLRRDMTAPEPLIWYALRDRRLEGWKFPNTPSPRSDVLRRWSQATSPCDGTTARRWLCLRTGSGITEARPHSRALPPPRTTWAKWTTRVYFVPQSMWPLPRSLRASEPVDPRERGGNDGAVSEQSQLCGCLSLSY